VKKLFRFEQTSGLLMIRVSTPAFDDPEAFAIAKAAVRVGSFVSAIIGFFVLACSTRKAKETRGGIPIPQSN
jgi:Na+/H+ antiporter NhaA